MAWWARKAAQSGSCLVRAPVLHSPQNVMFLVRSRRPLCRAMESSSKPAPDWEGKGKGCTLYLVSRLPREAMLILPQQPTFCSGEGRMGRWSWVSKGGYTVLFGRTRATRSERLNDNTSYVIPSLARWPRKLFTAASLRSLEYQRKVSSFSSSTIFESLRRLGQWPVHRAPSQHG
jgi:hypothetical protein